MNGGVEHEKLDRAKNGILLEACAILFKVHARVDFS